MVEITVIITENDNDYQANLETLNRLATQATSWNAIFLKNLIRKIKVCHRDRKTFRLSPREKQILETITAQLAAKQGGEG